MDENKNPFKKIIPAESLPREHKEKVLNHLDTAKFLMELAELFTVKQAEATGKVASAVLDNYSSKKNNLKDK